MKWSVSIQIFWIFSPEYNWDNVGENKLVDSFDLQTEKWSSEDPFPFTPVGRSYNIPYGNTFLSIGGSKSDNQAANYIYTASRKNYIFWNIWVKDHK